MKRKLQILGGILSIALVFVSHSYAQNNALIDVSYADDQTEIRKEWDNFKTRDASIFKFKFAIPQSYATGFESERDSKVLSSVSGKVSLSYYAKYSVFKITEEILSEKTGKTVIVADPDFVQNKLGMSPATNTMLFGDGKDGFDNFPYWTKKSFLTYDESVGIIMDSEVEILENFVKPTCKITLTLYDRNGKKINTYKHTKKFSKVDKITIKSKHYDELMNSIWETKIYSGVPITTIIDIYVQTLEEMLTEQNFTF
ncbi:MAG: hypothetical protein M9897_10785 [Brumimicrobium sp.]|nr:hypothetical protein [Brumimicrobium sp.]